jgi:hypothetical protein
MAPFAPTNRASSVLAILCTTRFIAGSMLIYLTALRLPGRSPARLFFSAAS